VGRRDARPGKILDGAIRAVVRGRRGEPAAAVAQLADARQLRAGLGQQVDPGDPEVRDAIADELDHVVGADEQDVQVVVLDAGDEGSVVLFEHQAGVAEQVDGRLDEATLVGDRQPEALGHRSAAPAG
jgi:hypothetical protein